MESFSFAFDTIDELDAFVSAWRDLVTFDNWDRVSLRAWGHASESDVRAMDAWIQESAA